MKTDIPPRDLELLSAYLDKQLDSGKRARLEARLQAEPELQRVYEDLRRTRTLLRSLPRVRAPRNFTLTPQMVGSVQARRSSPHRMYPFFQFASALASLLLVIVLVGDFFVFRAAPAAMPAERDFELMEAPVAAESAESAEERLLSTMPVEEMEMTETTAEVESLRKALPAPGAMETITEAVPLTLTVPATPPIAPVSPTGETGTMDDLSTLQGENNQPDRTVWRVVEISLAIMALAFGVAAIRLRRV